MKRPLSIGFPPAYFKSLQYFFPFDYNGNVLFIRSLTWGNAIFLFFFFSFLFFILSSLCFNLFCLKFLSKWFFFLLFHFRSKVTSHFTEFMRTKHFFVFKTIILISSHIKNWIVSLIYLVEFVLNICNETDNIVLFFVVYWKIKRVQKFVHPPWYGCVTILMVCLNLRCRFNPECFYKINIKKITTHFIWATIAKGEKEKNTRSKC